MKLAYILHRHPFKDHDVMVKVWLRDEGVKTAVMRGARKLNSRWRAVAHPFLPIQIQMRGKGEVLSVYQCEPLTITTHFSRQSQVIAFYLNELVLTFMHKYEPMPDIFDHYQQILTVLGEGNANVVSHIREFEMHLFNELGQGIHLTMDQNNTAIDPDLYYIVQPGSLPLQVAKTTMRAIPGKVLQEIDMRDWNSNSLRAAKYLCRLWVDYYSHGKKFKSRELLVKGA